MDTCVTCVALYMHMWVGGEAMGRGHKVACLCFWEQVC